MARRVPAAGVPAHLAARSDAHPLRLHDGGGHRIAAGEHPRAAPPDRVGRGRRAAHPDRRRSALSSRRRALLYQGERAAGDPRAAAAAGHGGTGHRDRGAARPRRRRSHQAVHRFLGGARQGAADAGGDRRGGGDRDPPPRQARLQPCVQHRRPGGGARGRRRRAGARSRRHAGPHAGAPPAHERAGHGPRPHLEALRRRPLAVRDSRPGPRLCASGRSDPVRHRRRLPDRLRSQRRIRADGERRPELAGDPGFVDDEPRGAHGGGVPARPDRAGDGRRLRRAGEGPGPRRARLRGRPARHPRRPADLLVAGGNFSRRHGRRYAPVVAKQAPDALHYLWKAAKEGACRKNRRRRSGLR